VDHSEDVVVVVVVVVVVCIVVDDDFIVVVVVDLMAAFIDREYKLDISRREFEGCLLSRSRVSGSRIGLYLRWSLARKSICWQSSDTFLARHCTL